MIADFEVTEEMLRYFIRKVIDRRSAHPRLIVCAPSGVTEVEKRAVEEASLAAGARQVHLIEEPIAAAIGAGLPIEEPVGRLVVDVGGGTSEMAVISLGGIVVFRSVRVGGYEMDEAISHYIRNVYQLAIGSRSAEQIKIEIGSALPLEEELTFRVRGRHLVTGLPTAVTLHSEEIREAISGPLREILQAIRDTLEQTPPELSADISKRRDPVGRRRHPDPRVRRHDRRRHRDARVPRRVAADLRGGRIRRGAGAPGHAEPHLAEPRAHADDAGLANRPGVSEGSHRPAHHPRRHPAREPPARQMDICPAAVD